MRRRRAPHTARSIVMKRWSLDREADGTWTAGIYRRDGDSWVTGATLLQAIWWLTPTHRFALKLRVRAWRKRNADPWDTRPTTPAGCDGSSDCAARLHEHGCFADVDGSRCDNSNHVPSVTTPGQISTRGLDTSQPRPATPAEKG